jgi:hypothetical protein
MIKADGMALVKVTVYASPTGGIGKIMVGGSPLFEVEPGSTVTECQVQIGLPYALEFDQPRLAVAYRAPTGGPEDAKGPTGSE